MYDLVVIGSPSLDRVLRDVNLFTENVLSGPSIISAATATRLGIENMIVIGSFSSQDSSLLENQLEKLDVPEYFKIDSPETGGFEIEFNGDNDPLFRRILGTPKSIGIRDIPEEFLSTRYIMLSPLLQEVGAELIEWLCNSTDAIILMDPQIRTSKPGSMIGIIDELDITSKTSCFLDYIKPNEEEARLITGESDPFVAAEILVDTIAENCIITLGGRGSILFDGTEFRVIPAFAMNNTNSFGAGAAFLTGFVSGLIENEDPAFCAALGASVASFKISGENTNFILDRIMAHKRAREIASEIQIQ